MKAYLIILGLCSSLILTLLISGFQVSFRQDYFYQVSSEDEDVEVHENEDVEAINSDEDIEIM